MDLDDLPYEDFLSQNEELERKKERESRRRGELLAKVDFSRYKGSQSLGSFIHVTPDEDKSQSNQKRSGDVFFFFSLF